MNRLLWKLLRRHVSAWQLGGFALANLVGLTIVVVAIQFYSDVRGVFDDEESFLRRDFLVINKKINSIAAIGSNQSAFSADEIQQLEAQPFCTKVGQFGQAHYSVRASLAVGSSQSLNSQIFFESIPTEFLDVNPDDWNFNEQKPVVPVIVAKDYLSLYNFGFATSAGMPKISEGMIGMIPLLFTIEGAGRQATLPGRIVGFSNRINTILVPEEFMRWSNERFGNAGGDTNPSRLIVEVNAPGDVRINDFMDSHEYEIAGDKGTAGKAQYFLNAITGVVISVGLVISALAFFVLMLSIFLILQKNSRKLQDLLMLGYSPRQVARPYVLMVLFIGIAVMLLAIVGMLVARAAYMPMLTAMGITGASVSASVAAAALIMTIITAGNILAIHRRIASLWRG